MAKTRLKLPLTKKLNDKEIESLETLIDDLTPLGIHIELLISPQGNTLAFEYDQKAFRRNAGRKRKSIPSGSCLSEMDQKQADAWILSNPIERIESELEVSRSTAFRRRAEARERFSYSVISLNDDDV